MVFDKNKGAIFALYNRALRSDPTLEGKLVLRLTIAPNGTVTFCEVVSSELGDPDLEAKLVARIKLFRFEAKDVEAITTTKPIDSRSPAICFATSSGRGMYGLLFLPWLNVILSLSPVMPASARRAFAFSTFDFLTRTGSCFVYSLKKSFAI